MEVSGLGVIVLQLIVRPHLECACSIWAPASHKDIDSLEGLQKFTFRMAMHNWSLNYQDLLSLVDLRYSGK